MTLVAGIDTSTQSCKVLVVDAETGRVVREGAASHPDATECHPDASWAAFEQASEQAGGLADVSAITMRFDQQARDLAAAAKMVGDANRVLETTVEERRRSLEDLAAGLVDKTQSVENLMQAFPPRVVDETAGHEKGGNQGACDECHGDLLRDDEPWRRAAITRGSRRRFALATRAMMQIHLGLVLHVWATA